MRDGQVELAACSCQEGESALPHPAQLSVGALAEPVQLAQPAVTGY